MSWLLLHLLKQNNFPQEKKKKNAKLTSGPGVNFLTYSKSSLINTSLKKDRLLVVQRQSKKKKVCSGTELHDYAVTSPHINHII